jgi:hypothetical protein
MNCYVKVPIIFLLLIKIKIISSFGVKNSIGKDRNSNSTLNWSDKTTSKACKIYGNKLYDSSDLYKKNL